MMRLYYAETLHPRKACAVARYLGSPVDFIRLDLGRGEHRTPQFLAMNPNGKVPVLEDGVRTLWESTAIMCYLSESAKSDLWPHDERQIDVLRWLSWDASCFTRSAGTLYFEYIIKPQFGIEAASAAELEQATESFVSYARVLNHHLSSRKFLVGEALTVADFAAAVTLPYADAAQLPLGAFPEIERWHERLCELSAWREPFPDAASARG